MVGHFMLLESHEKCTDGCVAQLGTVIYVSIQAFFKSSHYSGESRGGGSVYEWQDAPHIIFGLSDGSLDVNIHFVKPIAVVDEECQKSPTLIFLLCLSFVLFL